jgi:transposase
VTIATESLPDDPGMLKAMLLAERAESERLRQIISEFQRYRFGRRAESLPEEQLQLALEEAEQVEAAGEAESEAKTPAVGKARAAKRRANRGALAEVPAENKRLDAFVKIIANHRFHC